MDELNHLFDPQLLVLHSVANSEVILGSIGLPQDLITFKFPLEILTKLSPASIFETNCVDHTKKF